MIVGIDKMKPTKNNMILMKKKPTIILMFAAVEVRIHRIFRILKRPKLKTIQEKPNNNGETPTMFYSIV